MAKFSCLFSFSRVVLALSLSLCAYLTDCRQRPHAHPAVAAPHVLVRLCGGYCPPTVASAGLGSHTIHGSTKCASVRLCERWGHVFARNIQFLSIFLFLSCDVGNFFLFIYGRASCCSFLHVTLEEEESARSPTDTDGFDLVDEITESSDDADDMHWHHADSVPSPWPPLPTLSRLLTVLMPCSTGAAVSEARTRSAIWTSAELVRNRRAKSMTFEIVLSPFHCYNALVLNQSPLLSLLFITLLASWLRLLSARFAENPSPTGARTMPGPHPCGRGLACDVGLESLVCL